MSKQKILTREIADKFLKNNASVDLEKFTSIEDDAAKVLAEHNGSLGLRSLKKLSNEAAQSLCEHKGILDLCGLESLSETAAKHLSKHESLLDLTGLIKLGPQAAACLSTNHDIVFPYILKPEAAAGALEVADEVHCAKRPAIRNKKLKGLQIVLPVKKRPLHHIRKQSKLLKNLKSNIAELQHQCENALDLTALERLKSYLESTPGPCASFHFSMPKSVADLLCHGDWNESCQNLHEWATRELDALQSCYIDVENLTEFCNECIAFTNVVFYNQRYVKEDELMRDSCLQWRCIGDEIALMMSDQTDQYEVPPHELSDLFNRALPPELTMVYFDMGANGLYILMETKGMERRLSKFFSRKFEKINKVELKKEMISKAPHPPGGWPESWDDTHRGYWPLGKSQSMITWLDACKVRTLSAEFFTRSTECLAEEHSFVRTFSQGSGARLHLEQLSVEDAEWLASFPGEILEIRLRGPISDESATALAGFQGGELELSGISDILETSIKKLLSRRRSYLAILRNSRPSKRFDERTIAVDFPLSDACLKKLPAFKSERLFLKGIASLSDAGAKILSSFKGDLLYLDGITYLSEAAATALATGRCKQLRLDGLKSLTSAVAAALANARCGILHLNGLESISDTSAEALSAFKGKERQCSTSFELSLNGVCALSDAAAKSLAKTRVYILKLGGLKQISDVGLSKLAQCDGILELGIEHISESAAISFGKVPRCMLGLNALTEISDTAITAIAPSITHYFYLNSLVKLSVPAAQALAEGSGEIHLDGLRTLSTAVAAKLASYSDSRTLYLNGLRTLALPVAVELAKTSANLNISGIKSLGDAESHALAKKKKGHINLSGLTSLSDAAAQAFANSSLELEIVESKREDLQCWTCEAHLQLSRMAGEAVARVRKHMLKSRP